MADNLLKIGRFIRHEWSTIAVMSVVCLIIVGGNSIASINAKRVAVIKAMGKEMSQKHYEDRLSVVNGIASSSFLNLMNTAESSLVPLSLLNLDPVTMLRKIRSDIKYETERMQEVAATSRSIGSFGLGNGALVDSNTQRYSLPSERSLRRVYYCQGTIKERRDTLMPVFLRVARVNNIDPVILMAMAQVESQICGNVLSNDGAIGVLQLLPGTAEDMGVRDPWDIVQNIHGGARYYAYVSRLLTERGMANFCRIYACPRLSKIKAELQKGNGSRRKLIIQMYHAGEGNFFKGTNLGRENKRHIKKVIRRYKKLLPIIYG